MKTRRITACRYDKDGSDSSMVDENDTFISNHQGYTIVQIPLWSMKTKVHISQNPANLVQIPLWSMKTVYFEENTNDGYTFRFLYGRWKPRNGRPCMSSPFVQIPLWSMKTYDPTQIVAGSTVFRFLYGRWKPEYEITLDLPRVSSDSSMVDENSSVSVTGAKFISVQIPLWSMKTNLIFAYVLSFDEFRFLYGRWKRTNARNARCFLRVQIPLWSMKTSSTGTGVRGCRVQIPLWSMKTHRNSKVQRGLYQFRFLYGRWKLEKDCKHAEKYQPVQIPLWSMKTGTIFKGSRTWPVQIPLWSMKTGLGFHLLLPCASSDSSMVDENVFSHQLITSFLNVQIPLC